MSVPMKKRLDLPDPGVLKTSDPAVREYLTRLNDAVQDLNRRVRDALVSNKADGTLVIDDGTTRVTVVLDHGDVRSVVTAASTEATITWTST